MNFKLLLATPVLFLFSFAIPESYAANHWPSWCNTSKATIQRCHHMARQKQALRAIKLREQQMRQKRLARQRLETARQQALIRQKARQAHAKAIADNNARRAYLMALKRKNGH